MLSMCISSSDTDEGVQVDAKGFGRVVHDLKCMYHIYSNGIKHVAGKSIS